MHSIKIMSCGHISVMRNGWVHFKIPFSIAMLARVEKIACLHFGSAVAAAVERFHLLSARSSRLTNINLPHSRPSFMLMKCASISSLAPPLEKREIPLHLLLQQHSALLNSRCPQYFNTLGSLRISSFC